ncbi:alpha/beta fold hydrolase [Plantactinospora sp. GCM10030261]|uniref:alpha/beta fold hydrolase n=1 Tax=Plantactinospora sp. GCM10030261 TaxID=3273420 RepID=UPI0036105D59
MFDGFALDHVDVGQVRLRVRHGGRGPAVVLLHGHPRTHATWHRVAPLLAEDHTVICPTSARSPSTAGTTWPRRHRNRWPPRSPRFSSIDDLAA